MARSVDCYVPEDASASVYAYKEHQLHSSRSQDVDKDMTHGILGSRTACSVNHKDCLNEHLEVFVYLRRVVCALLGLGVLVQHKPDSSTSASFVSPLLMKADCKDATDDFVDKCWLLYFGARRRSN